MEKNGEIGLTGGSLKIRIILGPSEEVAEKGELDSQSNPDKSGCSVVEISIYRGTKKSLAKALRTPRVFSVFPLRALPAP
jgi:hypothetical protein